MNDRDRAIIFAQETMEKSFVVLDLETTGLDVNEGGSEAVSLGLVSKSGDILKVVRAWGEYQERQSVGGQFSFYLKE